LVNSAVFSPNERRIVTASDDGTARIWDVETGEALTPPLRHPVEVRSAVFRPNGRDVVTACADGRARIWSFPKPDFGFDRFTLEAEVLSANHLDETDGLIPLGRDAWREVWSRLRQP
jgi:WD40 repeat protein